MDVPAPKPAQVIRYAYLWADEHETGREEGSKDRPTAVVMTTLSDHNQLRVVVLPITHSPPLKASSAVEIPAPIKRHLGLDDLPSWIVIDEMNVFNWPGPDLRPIGSNQDTCLYGYLPAGFFNSVKRRVIETIAAGRLRQIPRTE